MRPVIPRLACVALALWAAPTGAQPLFHNERNWTVEVGGRLYGFVDVVQTPGDFRRTRVWIADRLFEPDYSPADWWLWAVPPVGFALAVRYITRPAPAGRRP